MATDDNITGTAEDEHLVSGGGDDTIDAGAGDDTIIAGGGDDILIGGEGDDILNGGGGSDIFIFNFLVESGGGGETGVFETAEDRFIRFVNEYRNFLAQQDGVVAVGELQAYLGPNNTVGFKLTIELQDGSTATWDSLNVDDPLTINEDGSIDSMEFVFQGGLVRTVYYEDTVNFFAGGEAEIISSDGNDTIVQFQDAGKNTDQIVLNGLGGLTAEEIDALMDIEVIDTDGDGVGDAQRVFWTEADGDGGSITILGTTEWGDDLAAFLGDEMISVA